VLTPSEREEFISLDAAGWERADAAFKQLNDLSRVQKHIPAAMLGKIESYASQLAGKITAGEQDLQGLDLQAIGEDVLRQCSEDDMNALASNIGDLLPALGSLQQTVQQQTGLMANLPLPGTEPPSN
jgi:hypothetical protein